MYLLSVGHLRFFSVYPLWGTDSTYCLITSSKPFNWVLTPRPEAIGSDLAPSNFQELDHCSTVLRSY